MIGLANYLLEKEAGLKQVKRMLEAAQKSPEAAKWLALPRGNWRLSEQEQIGELLSGINKTIEDSKHINTMPSRVLTGMKIREVRGRTQSGVPLSLENTEHEHALEVLRQAFGRRGQRNATGTARGSVDVFDLGAVRPKDKVGISTPHTTRDPIGATYLNTGSPNKYKGLSHLPDDPKYPGSQVAKLRQEYAGSKPLAEQDVYHAAKQRPSNRDMRFETVVEGSYLQDKKIGEFTQITGKEAPVDLNHPSYHTALTGRPEWVREPSLQYRQKLVRTIGDGFDRDNARSLIKANLSGEGARRAIGSGPQPVPIPGLDSPLPVPITAIDQMRKSKAVRRFHQSPITKAPDGYTPLKFKPEFQQNQKHYHGTNAADWPGAAYPSENRYVGKGRAYSATDFKPGSSYWTSELIPAVPTNYAGHMDLSKGNLYYKTDNPKAFGKAMNKYLDKPIEGGG